MRSDVREFDLVAPPTLDAALRLLAERGTDVTPLAGGTEVMVALGVGRLPQRSFVSIQHLRELRFIRAAADAITIGAGATFTDIRDHAGIAAHWPLLARAASWTGSIANQNRGTIGGNICNASPAADTPPALLAYDAHVTLVSTRGERTLPYNEFHLGYKKTALSPDELLFSVTVPRPPAGAQQYIRKVGTRNAQAISKVALAAIATVEEGKVAFVRIGAASLADRPVRCSAAEAALAGASLAAEDVDTTVRRARAALAAEAKPIDDIRSTALYRTHVAANLLEEFVRSLASEGRD